MPRKAAASSAYDDLPWWGKFVGIVGAPTVASGAFIWAVLKYFPIIAASLQQMQMDAEKAHQVYAQHMQQDAAQDERMLAVLERVCLNSSKTDADRLACISIRAPQ